MVSIKEQSGRRMNRVLLLLGFSLLINYIDRSNLSIAAPLIKDELGLSAAQLGTLLSAFFWTYGLMQIPAGWLADRFDVKWVFATGFFLWSAATASTSVLHGFAALVVIRVILGIGESVAFPSYSNILGHHFAENQRGFANAVLTAGLALGPALGLLVGGSVVGRFGWRPFFLVLGAGSLVWLFPWVAWMPRRPPAAAPLSEVKVGIPDILRQRSVWGTCVGQFCINYTLYFLLTWLPFYLVRGRNLAIEQMGKVGGLFFLLFSVSSIAFGKLADRWITVGASATRVRKTFLGVAHLGLGAFLLLTAVAPDSAFVWVLMPVAISMGMSGSNCWAVTQTLAGPRLAGRWTGVQNFVGNFAGAVAPALTGYLLDRTGQYYWPFVIAAAVSWSAALTWVLAVGPIEPVDWKKNLGRSPVGGEAAPATDAAQP